MEPFKNAFNEKFVAQISIAIKGVIPDFDIEKFTNTVFDKTWPDLELKGRMRHLTICLRPHLENDYPKSLKQYLSIVEEFKKIKFDHKLSVEFMFTPDYVEYYGLNYYDESIAAIEQITQFMTCEFAVRPFIIKYPEKMTAQMVKWSNHRSWAVRRLSTEGIRPRLPWGMALPIYKKDPTPILPILEKLKNDEHENVRLSVANNLNDISKDNPELVIDIVKKWKGQSVEVDWLIKHASRTLLKAGNSEIMSVFGFGSIKDIKIENFDISTPKVKIGDSLSFSFNLNNLSNSVLMVRLEYAVYYQKANGTLSKKVYKISEKEYLAKSTNKINRNQPFKIITTRKLHTGLHQIALVINGVELKKNNFTLTA